MDTEAIMKKLVSQDNYPQRVCDMVKKMVATYYGFPISAYESKSRRRENIKMKQAAVYFIKKLLPDATLMFIGDQMGYDHASVLHHYRVVTAQLELKSVTKREIDDMAKTIHLKQNVLTLSDVAKDDYYFANFDKCSTIQLPSGQCIAVSGMLPNQVDDILKLLSGYYATPLTKLDHNNTGLFVFEKIKREF
jgi:hypothetical protein